VSDSLEIRAAREEDAEFIFAMVVELAEYEKAPEMVHGNAEMLREALFGEHPYAEAIIAEWDGERVGSAVFHHTFSTWECRPGIWLEDLYVRPAHRRHGIGEQMLRHLAKIAVDRGCNRYGWVALDWNTPALEFYEKLGASTLDEWKLHRLADEALTSFAAGARTQ
jgi:GNAT superfamily N-acetyltransferase